MIHYDVGIESTNGEGMTTFAKTDFLLAEGLTAKKQDGQRSPRQGLAESLLMGLPLGALPAAALAAIL